MTISPKNCERSCPCEAASHDTRFIVLTGGPGAGKTAVLELLSKVLCRHVAVLPEAASILFGGGFWRLDSRPGKMAAQRAIYHVQAEMQRLVLEERKWSIALCDRGTLDGLAYWPGKESEFFAELRTSLEMEYQKYKAVIHLCSPSADNGYNYQNPVRVESAVVAATIDSRINDVWKMHPDYHVIESTSDFMEKVHTAAKLVQSFVPECCLEHVERVGI